jgi:hypothetical protein
MEERRTFFEWVKCPVEFGKKFDYVIFQGNYGVHRFVKFRRRFKTNYDREEYITLDFQSIYLNEEDKLTGGLIKEFYSGWYDKAECITEQQALDYLLKFKHQHTNVPKEEKKKSWFNISDWLS